MFNKYAWNFKIQKQYFDFLIIFRERENHSAHLASIEAELDSQVAKVD